jgi:hypothetical protein
MSSEDPVEEFRWQYLSDLLNQQVGSLSAYQGRWPGHGEAIAAEYRRICDAVTAEAAGLAAASRGTSVPMSPGGAVSSDQVGPFRLIRPLGSGGQGVVYLAEDTRLRRRVALKVLLHPGVIPRDRLERFRREAEITSRLDHPGICTAYETGTVGGTAYISMRYVEGETLAVRIAAAKEAWDQGGPSTVVNLPETAEDPEELQPSSPATPSGPSTQAEIQRLLHFFEKAARALHAAHLAGVIHRDIKPGNLMVIPEGAPVILDFGLARASEENQPAITRTGDLFGTPVYMSPEQIAAQRTRWTAGRTSGHSAYPSMKA